MAKHLGHVRSTVVINRNLVEIKFRHCLEVTVMINGGEVSTHSCNSISQSRIAATKIADQCVKIGTDISENHFVELLDELVEVIRNIAHM